MVIVLDLEWLLSYIVRLLKRASEQALSLYTVEVMLR